MRRFSLLVSIVAIVLVGVLVSSRTTSGTAAQDVTPAAMADHPVVGAWRWLNDPTDPDNISFSIFHADGTYAETNSLNDVAIGVWRPTGERTVDLTIVHQDINFIPFDPDVFEPGTLIGHADVEVDPTGNTISAPITVYVWSADEAFQFSAGPFVATAARMEIDLVAPFGAAAEGTPTS